MRITPPREHEPVRLVDSRQGPRYRAVLDTGARPDGSRRQTTRTFATLGAARAWVAETRTQVARGTFTAPDRGTLAGLCERWLTARRDVREVTRLGYRQALRPVVCRLGQRRVQDIRRADIEALVTWLGSEGGQRGHGLGHRSVVYTLGTLRQVLAYGVAEGLLPANPADGVRAPRKQHSDNRRVAVWDPADVVRFRRVADADAWAAGWRLTLCGLRRSEVLGLSWRSVDLDAGTVRVEASRVLLDGHRTAVDQPKSAASRRVVPVEAMHPGTIALMRTERASQAADRLAAGPAYGDSGLMLVDALGAPIRPEAYSDRFRGLCRDADVPAIRLHDVRHSLALAMHRAGSAPADAAALLGHTVAMHLTTYVPATERGAQSAATALGGALSAAE